VLIRLWKLLLPFGEHQKLKSREYWLERAADGVSVERLADLMERDHTLSILEANGVDNWEGYCLYDEEDDDEDY